MSDEQTVESAEWERLTSPALVMAAAEAFVLALLTREKWRRKVQEP